MKQEMVQISKKEYENMLELMECMQENIEVLSDAKLVRKLNEAIQRTELK